MNQPIINTEPWVEHATCATSPNPDLWFPDKINSPAAHTATRICKTCPVQQNCLNYALEHGLQGIWGGKNSHQRADIAHQRARNPKNHCPNGHQLTQHGTNHYGRCKRCARDKANERCHEITYSHNEQRRTAQWRATTSDSASCVGNCGNTAKPPTPDNDSPTNTSTATSPD